MREYQRTHDWISFELDLRSLPILTWMQLGECKSKCEHIAGVPLRPETAQRLYQVYLAKGVAATTAIEGNTLSEEQVLQRLEGLLHVPPSQAYLQQEIDNIIAGCHQIVESIRTGGLPEISLERICTLNERVLHGLTLEDHVIPGRLRNYSVGVPTYRGAYRGAPQEDCAYLLERLCTWFNTAFRPDNPALRKIYAILQAVVAHVYLAWIHPFGDGNGRTARLLEFQILVSAGIPAPAAHLLSNHYNKTRSEYYRQLDRTSASGGELTKFLEYAVQGLLDGLVEQLDYIREQQLDVTWRNYVHERFREEKTTGSRRRRDLVLDLSRAGRHVSRADLFDLSARIARAYTGKTEKTLSRDLKQLIDMGLVVGDARRGYLANRSIILAFLPPVAPNEHDT